MLLSQYMFFLALVFVFSSTRLLAVAREGKALKNDIMMVVKGPGTIEEKELKMKEMKKQGMGLRLKFTLLIVILVSPTFP